MTAKILFTFRHAPYGSAIAREGLDALLAAAVYDQDLSVLFLNDGVLQLLSEQEVTTPASRNHARMLSALPIYGVTQVYVHRPSFTERGLDVKRLLLNPTVLSDAQTTSLLRSADQLLSF